MSGYVTSPPGLAIMGFERQYQPQPGVITKDDLVHAMNPLQHVPVVGIIYRAISGDTLPAPLAILGSVAVGAATLGPIGIAGTAMISFVTELLHLGPAVPGHTLLAADNPATADGPVPQQSAKAPGITYADGSTGSATWEAGRLTCFDVTLNQSAENSSDSSSETANRDLALAAYNRLVKAFGGLAT
jgi:hypothetical protein